MNSMVKEKEKMPPATLKPYGECMEALLLPTVSKHSRDV